MTEKTADPQEAKEKPAQTVTVSPSAPSDGGWQEAAAQNYPSAVKTLPSSAYSPIAGGGRVGRLKLVRKGSIARPWVARVFVKGNGRLDVFSWTHQPTIGELVWSGYRSVYDVDLSLRNLSLDVTLPSAGEAFVFRTEVDVQWRVEVPETVVTKGLTDIRPVVVPRLLAGLRQASRALETSDVETAEKETNAYFDSKWLLDEYGLWTNILVRLRMDAQTERNIRLEAEVRAFKHLIENGDLDQFALQLAQNPQDVQAVVEVLVAERDNHRKEVVEFITRLIESDALDRWQIDDQVRVMMQWMQASINRVLTGTDTARQLSFDDHRHSDPSRPEQDGPSSPADDPGGE
ncbi:hypothetical protein ED92_18090 [Amycolatopsis sp. MJM2582]|uniref:hypothetical protein n=1 Tax=Amycolatopsis sp. MJM2582 TaxID=1427749 RepID=UPI0005052C58|nr:hypothetical protein [Amycolatopsis sp. MJM2582]KFZ82123.1 hypothetical protein ED92_18090 [Amycolatopsis sp. MJM2582]